MLHEKHDSNQINNIANRNIVDQIWITKWDEKKPQFIRKCFQTFSDQPSAINFLVEDILPNPSREYSITLFASATIQGEITHGTIDLRTLL